jgi:THO complex subunit 3
MFNHTGDSVILTHMSEHAIRIVDVPSLALRENLAAHVGGCVAAALDPRGRYLASGGYDSIVNLFDTSEWIAARTITVCECVRSIPPFWIGLNRRADRHCCRQAISDLSFSHDGEYLAIAGAGNYIDIVRASIFFPSL